VPRFVLHHDGRRLLLPDGETVVGRSLECRIRFDDPSVSRRHLRLMVEGGRVTAWSLGSNGTLLNGAPITAPRVLADGDELRLGFQRVRFEALESAGAPAVGGARLEREAPDPGDSGWRRRRLTEEVLLPSRAAEMRVAQADARPRRSPRFAVAVPVIYASDSLIIDGVVRDLSRGGMFIATDVLDPIGTPCDVTAMPAGRPGLRFVGVVARVADQPSPARVHGLGIQLVTGAPDAMSWLEQTLSHCSHETVG
jgi:hypothetical protein